MNAAISAVPATSAPITSALSQPTEGARTGHYARSIGSYSVRIYSTPSARPDDDTTFFSSGVIRARDGTVDRIFLADLGNDGAPSLVVSIRSSGSGGYLSITSGVNPLGTGSTRIRNDLSVIPRTTFHDDAHQSLDMRLTKDVRLPGGMKLTGIAEIFNLYNYARFSYNLIENAPTFLQRQGSAGPPRSAQLAFKLSF